SRPILNLGLNIVADLILVGTHLLQRFYNHHRRIIGVTAKRAGLALIHSFIILRELFQKGFLRVFLRKLVPYNYSSERGDHSLGGFASQLYVLFTSPPMALVEW